MYVRTYYVRLVVYARKYGIIFYARRVDDVMVILNLSIVVVRIPSYSRNVQERETTTTATIIFQNTTIY